MALNLILFDLKSIDIPTLVFIIAVQVVVVVALFFLGRLYKALIPSLSGFFRKPDKVKGTDEIDKHMSSEKEEDVNACIALALYLHYSEIHDEESNVITIQRISKTYSPWSSKIYNMRNFR